MPICTLCLAEVPALRRSHILPEPFYSSAYDEKGRYPIFSSTSSLPIGRNEQKGLRERLLGDCCERKLSVWETYGLGQMWNRTNADGVDMGAYFEFKVDYEKLKLYHLSLLWRMGVASHVIFSGVQLGPKHLDRLHGMLRSGDPGREHEYVCQLAALASSDDKLSTILILPNRRRTKTGHASYDLIARGFLWQFLVSSPSHRIPSAEIPLTESGVFKVYKRGTIPEDRYLPVVSTVEHSNKAYFADSRPSR